MTIQACCICSVPLDTYDAKSEKPVVPDRDLGCCGRIICLRCTTQNQRYRTYCLYCQISTSSSVLPQGLRDPPAYDSSSSFDHDSKALSVAADDSPPAYSAHLPLQLSPEKQKPKPDALHFLTPTDSLASLALAYGIPVSALRRANNLFSDHLIVGRKTLLIPGGGESLSPTPLDSAEEEARKTRIRRFMVRTKCAEYDVAVMYLQQSGDELEDAVEAYWDDERWERENPLEGEKRARSAGTTGMRRFVGRRAG